MRKPVVLEQGQRFTLRDGTTTLGTGVVTKILSDLSPDELLKLEKGRTRKERLAFKERIAALEEQLNLKS